MEEAPFFFQETLPVKRFTKLRRLFGVLVVAAVLGGTSQGIQWAIETEKAESRKPMDVSPLSEKYEVIHAVNKRVADGAPLDVLVGVLAKRKVTDMHAKPEEPPIENPIVITLKGKTYLFARSLKPENDNDYTLVWPWEPGADIDLCTAHDTKAERVSRILQHNVLTGHFNDPNVSVVHHNLDVLAQRCQIAVSPPQVGLQNI